LITTLYLISNLAWFHFKDFDDDYQIDSCLAMKTSIESRFNVKGVCLSKWGKTMILNNQIYGDSYAKSRK